MKKFRMLMILSMMMLVLSFVLVTNSVRADSVCAECDLYTYETILPYLVPADADWWTGVAITNTSRDDVLVRLDFVGDGGFVQRVDVPAQSIEVFVPDITAISYARVRSTEPLFIQVMIGNGSMLQGYSNQLVLINPPSAATCVDVGQ